MTYSFYDGTVGMAKSALLSLDRIITKAEEHPDSATFFNAKLIDDMEPLTFQVHYATFQAEAVAVRLVSNEQHVEPAKDVDTFAKMHARIQQALAMLDKVDKDKADQLAETMTTFPRRGEDMQVPVKGVVGQLNMPNIYFHVGMAYAILRKEGVSIGKRDWHSGFVRDYI